MPYQYRAPQKRKGDLHLHISKEISIQYWLTTKLTELRLQWPHKTKNEYITELVQKSVNQQQQQATITTNPGEGKEFDVQSYQNTLFENFSFQQKKLRSMQKNKKRWPVDRILKINRKKY